MLTLVIVIVVGMIGFLMVESRNRKPPRRRYTDSATAYWAARDRGESV